MILGAPFSVLPLPHLPSASSLIYSMATNDVMILNKYTGCAVLPYPM